MTWEQELYNQLVYAAITSYFHSFPGDVSNTLYVDKCKISRMFMT